MAISDSKVSTLAEWYEHAENITKNNRPRKGDTVIYPVSEGSYSIEKLTQDWSVMEVTSDQDLNTRILERGVRSSWENAFAVMANSPVTGKMEVYTKASEDSDVWVRDGGLLSTADLARGEVIPLVPALVTDEMITAAVNAYLETDYAHEDMDYVIRKDFYNALKAALEA